MAVKKGKDLGFAWQCECGKWNFPEAKACWKCHTPKDATLLKPKVKGTTLRKATLEEKDFLTGILRG